ncbi:major capsid protein [Photobacterium chitinilyticum]|uniref:major capsid protein n=1 Tax=Photobacterium chitinilyticum TaxID=2485123 RepID=UPI003D10EF2B
MKKQNIALVILLTLGAVNPAFAEGAGTTIDTGNVVALIGGGLTAAVSAIGLAKLGPAGVSMAYKWVKGAIFG